MEFNCSTQGEGGEENCFEICFKNHHGVTGVISVFQTDRLIDVKYKIILACGWCGSGGPEPDLFMRFIWRQKLLDEDFYKDCNSLSLTDIHILPGSYTEQHPLYISPRLRSGGGGDCALLDILRVFADEHPVALRNYYELEPSELVDKDLRCSLIPTITVVFKPPEEYQKCMKIVGRTIVVLIQLSGDSQLEGLASSAPGVSDITLPTPKIEADESTRVLKIFPRGADGGALDRNARYKCIIGSSDKFFRSFEFLFETVDSVDEHILK